MVKQIDSIEENDRYKENFPTRISQTEDISNEVSTNQLMFDSFDELGTSVGTLQVSEISMLTELSSLEQVMSSLRSIDWSFTREDTQYLSHNIHPYPAKYIPQIPAHLIARLSLKGEKILDPFGGSGTTAVEALRLGRQVISLDANPLSSLIGKVKTTPLTYQAKKALLQLFKEVKLMSVQIFEQGEHLSQELATTHRALIPNIPNIEHWFSITVIGELAFLKYQILSLDNELARNLALLVFSKLVTRVSNQDAETRYAAVEKKVSPGFTLQNFLFELQAVDQRITLTAPLLQSNSAVFHTIDTRALGADILSDNSVDLVVTSPPYPNVTDYHLYHRFRLYWLGYQPISFAHTEIGSHLKHQRENSGFEDYLNDLRYCLQGLYRILRPGRYAALVVGDGMYKNVVFNTAEALNQLAKLSGFEECGLIERPIHSTKRSFSYVARRAQTETIVILKKPASSIRVSINITPPNYRLRPYEEVLRKRETEILLDAQVPEASLNKPITLDIPVYKVPELKRLTFSHSVTYTDTLNMRTWQALLENAHSTSGRRKEPKYATHGIHPYKGKFYPQLVKSLINISGIGVGAKVFDPFCGSGTTILEAFLNGYRAFGCDMHPLAVKITKAKTNILSVNEDECKKVLSKLLEKLANAPANFPQRTSQFVEEIINEIYSWFPKPVIHKMNWLLSQIRAINNENISEFLEVIFSSIVRDISQQDPRDLRIRRRDVPIEDAPVIELFMERLTDQFNLLQSFWKVEEHQPFWTIAPQTVLGDCRKAKTITDLNLAKATIDLIVTSPPYSTALPYIDTDRLSLLTLFNMQSKERGLLEERLTGSREISKREKATLDSTLNCSTEVIGLPYTLLQLVRNIHSRNEQAKSGFRKQNVPATLLRYFHDMSLAFDNMAYVLKTGASAFVVVGDSKTTAGEEVIPIPTTNLLVEIATQRGLHCVEQIPISVTTENMAHMRNAIVENAILHFVRES